MTQGQVYGAPNQTNYYLFVTITPHEMLKIL